MTKPDDDLVLDLSSDEPMVQRAMVRFLVMVAVIDRDESARRRAAETSSQRAVEPH